MSSISTTDTLLLVIIVFMFTGWLGAKHLLDRIIIILERIRKGDRGSF